MHTRNAMNFSKLHKISLVTLGLIPFAYWCIKKIQQDLWWDEIISLKDYALEGFTTTVTVYPDPNNHILFNLMDGLIVKIFGWTNIYEVLNNAFILRTFQAIIALLTVVYTYKIAAKFFSKKFAFISIAFLCSSIPFLNFSLQLRGYNLSILLLVMCVFYTWSFISNKKIGNLILTSTLVFASLYTLPSNIYFFFAFFLTLLFDCAKGLFVLKSKTDKKNLKQTYLYLFLGLFIALSLCYLAYTPVLDTLLNNRFVDATPRKKAYVLNTLLPSVITSFFSYRWLLLLLPIPLLIFRKKIRKNKVYGGNDKTFHFFLFVLLPFVFLSIHNKQPFERTFVVLIPFFALFISSLTIKLLECFEDKLLLKSTLSYGLVIYICSTAIYQLYCNEQSLDLNLTKGKREQNIYRNYYLADNFQPHKLAQFLSAKEQNKEVLLVDELDRVSFTFYLKKYNIQSQSIIKIMEKTQMINGKKSTHLGIVQFSGDRTQDIKYQQYPCVLPPIGKQTNYFFISELNFQKTPKKECILLSCFPKKMDDFKQSLKNYITEDLDPVGAAHLLKMKKK